MKINLALIKRLPTDIRCMTLRSYLTDLFDFNYQRKLKDRTKDVFDYLIKQKTNRNFTMFMYTKANVREGKTYMSFCFANWLLKHDTYLREIDGKFYPRIICIWKGSPGFLALIQKYCPPSFRNRFYIADRIFQLIPNSFVIIDEGITAMDKYNDASGEAKNWTESQVQFGHFRVSVWASSQSNQLSVAFRKLANFKGWKKLSDSQMQYNKAMEKFERSEENGGHFEEITVCPKPKMFFHSTMDGLEGDGYIWVNHFDTSCPYRCEWWNEEISSNASTGSIDAKLVKDQRFKITVDDVCRNALDEGELFTGMGWEKVFFGWIRDNYPKEYSELSMHRQQVIDLFAYYKKTHKVLKEKEEYSTPLYFYKPANPDLTFPQYIRNIWNRPEEREVVAVYCETGSINAILNIVSKAASFVHPIVKNFLMYAGDLFEKYFRSRYGYDATNISPRGVADLIDTEGRIFGQKDDIFSIKFFSQNRKWEIEWNPIKDLNPELTKAIELKHPYFYLVMFDPSWDPTCIFIKKVWTGCSKNVVMDFHTFKKKIEVHKKASGEVQILLDNNQYQKPSESELELITIPEQPTPKTEERITLGESIALLAKKGILKAQNPFEQMMLEEAQKFVDNLPDNEKSSLSK